MKFYPFFFRNYSNNLVLNISNFFSIINDEAMFRHCISFWRGHVWYYNVFFSTDAYSDDSLSDSDYCCYNDPHNNVPRITQGMFYAIIYLPVNLTNKYYSSKFTSFLSKLMLVGTRFKENKCIGCSYYWKNVICFNLILNIINECTYILKYNYISESIILSLSK